MEKANDEPERAPELNGLVESALFVEGGAHPTPVIDRFWFKSVYFREPGVAFLNSRLTRRALPLINIVQRQNINFAIRRESTVFSSSLAPTK